MKRKLLLATLLLLQAAAALGDPNPPTAGATEPQLITKTAQPIHDTNQVAHFWFDYPYHPQPGSRVWINVSPTNWVEVYPDGSQSRYRLVGRQTVDGQSGVVVSKTAGDVRVTETLNDGSFQAFLPDKNSVERLLYFRRAAGGQWQAWRPLAKINPIE